MAQEVAFEGQRFGLHPRLATIDVASRCAPHPDVFHILNGIAEPCQHIDFSGIESILNTSKRSASTALRYFDGDANVAERTRSIKKNHTNDANVFSENEYIRNVYKIM